MSSDQFPTPVAGRQILRCDRCRRSDDVTHADLMRYMTKGWPTCCGEVMAYFTEAKRPNPTSDTEERPAFPG